MQSRRVFVTRSTLLAGAFVLGAGRGTGLAGLRSVIDPASIDRLRSKLSGRLILPDNPAYETHARSPRKIQKPTSGRR